MIKSFAQWTQGKFVDLSSCKIVSIFYVVNFISLNLIWVNCICESGHIITRQLETQLNVHGNLKTVLHKAMFCKTCSRNRDAGVNSVEEGGNCTGDSDDFS